MRIGWPMAIVYLRLEQLLHVLLPVDKAAGSTTLSVVGFGGTGIDLPGLTTPGSF